MADPSCASSSSLPPALLPDVLAAATSHLQFVSALEPPWRLRLIEHVLLLELKCMYITGRPQH